MLDDSLRLRDNPRLLALLSHYAQQAVEDRATWRDRLMQMDGVEPWQLTVLHGELIAFDWIEQNTGQAFSAKEGTLSACYRITLNGLREFRKFSGVDVDQPDPQPVEKPQPRFARGEKKSRKPRESKHFK